MHECRSILLTGGSACGKSSYAEALVCQQSGRRLYIATMRPFGAQGMQKVERHRALRAGKGFETVECYESLRTIGEDVLLGRDALRGKEVLPGKGALLGNEAPRRNMTSDSVDGDERPVVLLECIANLMANLLFDNNGTMRDATTMLDEVCAGIEHLRAHSRLLVIVTNDVGADGCDYGTETIEYMRAIGAANCRIAAGCDAVAELIAGVPCVIKGQIPPVNVREGAIRW